MLKRFALLLATVATAVLAATSTASAGGSSDAVAGLRCVKAGVTFLIQNDLFKAAALRQIDYDTIDSDGGGDAGLINTDLPPGSYLSLATVIRLHYTNPELFDWCA